VSEDLMTKVKSNKKARLTNMYMGHVVLPSFQDSSSRFLVIVTTRKLVLRVEPVSWGSGVGEHSRKPVQAAINWNDISKCLPASQGVIIHAYNSLQGTVEQLSLIKPHESGHLLANEYLLWCPDEMTRINLYELLLRRRSLMGDSANMPDNLFDEVKTTGGGGSHSVASSAGSLMVAASLTTKLKNHGMKVNSPDGGGGAAAAQEKPYSFGSANISKGMSLNEEEMKWQEEDIFASCKKALIEIRSDRAAVQGSSKLSSKHKSVLDMTAWDAIRVWMGIRNAFTFKKITILIFVNESNVPVQVINFIIFFLTHFSAHIISSKYLLVSFLLPLNSLMFDKNKNIHK
jgi:hypothetical protein